MNENTLEAVLYITIVSSICLLFIIREIGNAIEKWAKFRYPRWNAEEENKGSVMGKSGEKSPVGFSGPDRKGE